MPQNGESANMEDIAEDIRKEAREEAGKAKQEEDEVEGPEVVEAGDMQPSEETQALATFSEREGAFRYKILPVIAGNETDWRVVVYSKGVQGPVYQSTKKIDEEARASLGMSKRLQERINSALDYADRELQIDPALGDQSRDKRSLHELEVLMNE